MSVFISTSLKTNRLSVLCIFIDAVGRLAYNSNQALEIPLAQCQDGKVVDATFDKLAYTLKVPSKQQPAFEKECHSLWLEGKNYYHFST